MIHQTIMLQPCTEILIVYIYNILSIAISFIVNH